MTPADVMLVTKAHRQREESADWRAGLVTAAIINVHRSKGTKAAKPEDFVRKPPRQAEPQEPEQMQRILIAMTRALGGTVTQC